MQQRRTEQASDSAHSRFVSEDSIQYNSEDKSKAVFFKCYTPSKQSGAMQPQQ